MTKKAKRGQRAQSLFAGADDEGPVFPPNGNGNGNGGDNGGDSGGDNGGDGDGGDQFPPFPPRRPGPNAALLRPHVATMSNHGGEAPSFPVFPPSLDQTKRAVTRYGWRRDLPDQRDHLYAAPMFTHLPAKVDIRPPNWPAYDQEKLNSCTANAIAAAIQFERMKQSLPSRTLVPSRLFIYYNERVIENHTGWDAGAQIRDGIKCVAAQGACFEGSAKGQWPYKIDKFATRPPPPCYAAAVKDRTVSYSRLTQSLQQLKGCLASGYPFIFGFTVYESFETPSVAHSGVLNMPASGEKVIGGHAVAAVGYDDEQQRFLIRNSWGPTWGQSGCFTMPYAYLLDTNLTDDFWTVRLVSG